MLVEILKDIFEDDSNGSFLDRIYFEFEEKHRLLMRDDDDITALMESNWYKNLNNQRQNFIYESIEWSMNNSTQIPQCVISNSFVDGFSPKEALKYLEQQFVILIENRLNDAPFIDTLIRHFPKQSKKISLFKNEKWLRYGMGGGNTIEHDVKAELATFEDKVFVKKKSRYIRYFVILDSDKEYPSMDYSTSKKVVIQFLTDNNIEYHILEKREMENYLPDDAFSEISNQRDYIDAYLSLKSEIQKDYFDIEKGFKNIKFDKLSLKVQELFEDISDYQKEIFRNSSLKKINYSDKDNFKSDFPKLFLSENVNKINLLKRCSNHSDNPEIHPYDKNELPNLLKRINNLL